MSGMSPQVSYYKIISEHRLQEKGLLLTPEKINLIGTPITRKSNSFTNMRLPSDFSFSRDPLSNK